MERTQVADYFDIHCKCFIELLAGKNPQLESGPEPLNFYHSDTGTLFLFNNHVKVQNCDSLVEIYQYTFHILFTLLLIVDQNLTKLLSFRIKLHNSRKINYGIIFYN